MTSNFIHRVVNKSAHTVQLMFIKETDQMSYDLVLGPGETVSYDAIYGEASAPVPGSSPNGFHESHIRLQIGTSVSALYEADGTVRQSPGDYFTVDAPRIGGFAGPGPLELTIDANNNVVGKALDFATGPRLAATAWTMARYAIYGINETDGTLVEKPYLTDHWGTWASVGRPSAGLRGPLTAVSWVDGRYSVYALGKDGLMYEKAWLTTRWEEWMQHASPPGVALRELSAVKWETGRYGIYAVAENGNLFQKWWATDRWHDWEDLGRPDPVSLVGPVTAVCWSAYRYGIYALGSDGQVWQKWYGGSWSGWEAIGSPSSRLKSLCAASWADREYAVAGIGEDGQLWSREYKHGWGKWNGLGKPAGVTLLGPATAVSWRLTQMAYYVKASNGLLYQRWGNNWSPLDGK